MQAPTRIKHFTKRPVRGCRTVIAHTLKQEEGWRKAISCAGLGASHILDRFSAVMFGLLGAGGGRIQLLPRHLVISVPADAANAKGEK